MNSSIKTQTSYNDQIFKEESLVQATLVSNEFHNCTFVECAFAEAVFRSCRFVDCTFRQCDLSLIQVPDSAFSTTRFEESRVIGIDWTLANWGAIRLGMPIAFYKCVISYAIFIGLHLRGIEVKDCTAVEVDFREADLSQANFAGTDLSQSLFFNTDLTEANFRGARNYQIAPGQNVIAQAKFSMPEALSLLYNLNIVLTEEA